MDISRIGGDGKALEKEVTETVHDMFQYHSWDTSQTEMGNRVRSALQMAVEAIIAYVPPGPDRSTAIRKLREARMDCNSAISHNGKY